MKRVYKEKHRRHATRVGTAKRSFDPLDLLPKEYLDACAKLFAAEMELSHLKSQAVQNLLKKVKSSKVLKHNKFFKRLNEIK